MTIVKLSCKGVIKVMRKGSLTVEFTLLMFIILAVGGALLAAQLRIERHNQIFDLVEDAGKDTAKSLYALMRLKSSILEDGKTIKQSHYGVIGSIIGAKVDQVGTTLGEGAVETLLNAHLLRRAGAASMADFQTEFNLAKPLQFDFTFERHALLIDVTQSYRSPLSWLSLGDAQLADRHIIPLRAARSSISGHSDTEMTTVTITNHGKNQTRVYHTMDCFGLRKAKQRYCYRVAGEMIGGNIEFDGVQYSLCHFCRKRQ